MMDEYDKPWLMPELYEEQLQPLDHNCASTVKPRARYVALRVAMRCMQQQYLCAVVFQNARQLLLLAKEHVPLVFL